MSDAALHSHRPASHTHRGSSATTQRWAVGVLAGATALLLAYVTVLVATAWFLVSAFDAVAARQSVPVDVLAVARDVAPVLLVGWCTGLAASAVLARGEALGARTAGIAAGALGTAAGATMLALTGLL